MKIHPCREMTWADLQSAYSIRTQLKKPQREGARPGRMPRLDQFLYDFRSRVALGFDSGLATFPASGTLASHDRKDGSAGDPWLKLNIA